MSEKNSRNRCVRRDLSSPGSTLGYLRNENRVFNAAILNLVLRILSTWRGLIFLI